MESKLFAMKAGWSLLVLILTVSGAAFALGPHEVLVLANGKSPDSVEIAKEFVRLRNVPQINMVRLDLPAAGKGSLARISPQDFTRLIWAPATRVMRERGIEDHILAWIYSVDFPVTVDTSPQISIQGITFLRNRPSDPEDVRKGTYSSPLFAGPNGPESMAHFPQTFDVYRRWLGDDMPLPSMMLGYMEERGNTRETVLKCLANGVASDGTKPEGTVFFVTSDDVRSRCRQWQFPSARRKLRSLGVESVITDKFPSGQANIIGLLMGAAQVNPGQDNSYLPGCMAEHLTSAAAIFHSGSQTKLSAWIKAGATASAGTVTEPFSAWMKFPNARFFVHYASGCCMIESFFQSIRCPLQILLIGEPLARPWAPKAEVILHGLEKETVSGSVIVRAEVKAEPGHYYGKFLFLLDGKIIGRDKVLEFDTAKVRDGTHTFRVVAYRTGMVRSQVFAERTIVISNR